MSQQDMYIHTLVILLRGYRSIMQFLCIKSHWFQLLNEFLWLNETWCTCWSDAFWLLFEYFMNKWRHINSLIMVFWSHYLKWCILIHLYVCMWPLIVHSCCFNLPLVYTLKRIQCWWFWVQNFKFILCFTGMHIWEIK